MTRYSRNVTSLDATSSTSGKICVLVASTRSDNRHWTYSRILRVSGSVSATHLTRHAVVMSIQSRNNRMHNRKRRVCECVRGVSGICTGAGWRPSRDYGLRFNPIPTCRGFPRALSPPRGTFRRLYKGRMSIVAAMLVVTQQITCATCALV